MQKQIQEIIERLAEKYNKPTYVIEEIYLSQFRMLRDIMKNREHKIVMLPSWGKYIPSLKKLEYIEKYTKQNGEQNEDNSVQGNEK